MASFFGEVIHPSSRAFWTEDDDEEVFDNQETKYTIKWSGSEPTQFDKFIIVETEIIDGFATACLLENAKEVCLINSPSEKNCAKIYCSNDAHICVIKTKLDLAEAGPVTDAITPLLSKSKSIFAITSEHISNFKSDQIHSKSFLKALYSSKASSDSTNFEIETLSQPNIVAGVCAGGLSYAEICDLHCIMYILYTDTFILDSLNALPLQKLFSKLLEKPLPSLKSVNFKAHNKGDLYM